MLNRDLPAGLIFTDEDKLLLEDICQRYKIDLEYKIAPKPYYHSYREYGIMRCYYKSRFMSWDEIRYIKAGRSNRKDRKFHFVLCEKAIVKNSKGEDYPKAPPESHKTQIFGNTTMIIIEMLNDDGIRKPHSLLKIREYEKRLFDLRVMAKTRIANQYQHFPYPIKEQMLLFV